MLIRLRAWWHAAGLIFNILFIVAVLGIAYFAVRQSGLLDSTEEAPPTTVAWTPPTEPLQQTEQEPAKMESGNQDGLVRIDISEATGQIIAEVNYPPDSLLAAPTLAPQSGSDLLFKGGTGFVVPAGECGFNSTCPDGLPLMFDLDEVGQRRFTEASLPAYGVLPIDSVEWLDAREACYQSPAWFVADCNLELTLGRYGTLIQDYQVDSKCLAQQYLGRLGLNPDFHPDAQGSYGWWLCPNALWNVSDGPAFVDSCNQIVGDPEHCQNSAHVLGFHHDILSTPNPPLNGVDPNGDDTESGQQPIVATPDLIGGAATPQSHDHDLNVLYAESWDTCNAARFMAAAAALTGHIVTETPVPGSCAEWRRSPSGF